MDVRPAKISACKHVKQFDWYRHWYPIVIPDTLDPAQPHRTQLLGINIVIWNDGPIVDGGKQWGSWHVSEDACPTCAAEADKDGSPSCRCNGVASQHAQRRRFPSKIVDELLFVFPCREPGAFDDAAAVDLPLVRELHDPAMKDNWTHWLPAGVRDFPCGWDTLVENCLDPAHFCAAHHGTVGNRYRDPGVHKYRVTEKVDLEGGFACSGDLGELEFRPPCLVKYHPHSQSMPFEGNLILATYCVPTAPGRFRVLAVVAKNNDLSFGETVAGRLLTLMDLVPKWLQHLLTPVVVAQDCGLLYGQYRNLRGRGYRPGREGSLDFERLVYCPNSVDAGPLAFRRWLRRAGGDVPWACEDLLPARGTEDVYELWSHHTRHCRYCTAAHANLEVAKCACAAVACLALVALPPGLLRGLVAICAGVLAAGLHALTGPNGPFGRFEHSHADNNFTPPWL